MNDIQKMAKLIQDVKFAMLTTVSNRDGSLHSRPMTVQKTKFDGNLWFFAGKSTELIQQIKVTPQVNVSFTNANDSSYVSACGEAEVVEDRAKAKELWDPFLLSWYPRGIDDPEICLIKVSVESADYWESPSSTLVRLADFAKAALRGDRARATSNTGKQGHLDIN